MVRRRFFLATAAVHKVAAPNAAEIKVSAALLNSGTLGEVDAVVFMTDTESL